jgi:hypothetical protein
MKTHLYRPVIAIAVVAIVLSTVVLAIVMLHSLSKPERRVQSRHRVVHDEEEQARLEQEAMREAARNVPLAKVPTLPPTVVAMSAPRLKSPSNAQAGPAASATQPAQTVVTPPSTVLLPSPFPKSLDLGIATIPQAGSSAAPLPRRPFTANVIATELPMPAELIWSAVDIALQGSHPDPAIAAWLRQWQSRVAAGLAPSDPRSSELKDILSHTQLTPHQLFEIGQLIGFILHQPETHDSRVVSINQLPWYRWAVMRAKDTSQGLVPGSADAERLVKILQRADQILWRFSDAEALEVESEVLLRILRSDDPEVLTARINLGGAYFSQGRMDDALKVTDAIANDPKLAFVGKQQAEYEWLRGLVLFANRRLEEALPHLKFAANASGFQHGREAKFYVAQTERMLGRLEDAYYSYKAFEESQRASAR